MSFTTSNLTLEGQYILITEGWSNTEKIVAIVVILFINISALALNLLLVAIIVSSKSLRRQPDTILIGNLAISDLLVACCIMPFTSKELMSGEIGHRNGLWTFIGFSNFLFCIASILNLAILSLDQCLNIKCPFWYKLHRTQSMAFIMASCVWIYSGMCALPPLFGIGSYSCFIPNTGPCSAYQWSGTNHSVVFTVIVTSCSWGIGVLILILSNIIIYSVIIKQRGSIKKTMVHKENCPKRSVLMKALSGNNSVQIQPPVAGNNSSDYKGNSPKHCVMSCDNPSGADLSLSRVPRTVDVANDDVLRHDTQIATITNADVANSDDSYSKLRHWKIILPNVVKPRKQSKKSQMIERDRPSCNCFPSTKHVKSLLIIVVAYIISWTPFCCLLLFEIQQKEKRYSELSLLFLWVGHMSSLINPALYFYRYKRFRQEAKAFFPKVLHNARIHPY